MPGKVLHVLSQRPARTGSGVTLDAILHCGARAGWLQSAVIGVPAGDPQPATGPLAAADVHPLRFFDPRRPELPADLDFPVPGMSDVMPYPSSVWSRLDADQLTAYRRTWLDHLQRVIEQWDPDLVHTNHVWLVSALALQAAGDRPVVATCHATGLRQLALCPHLAREVIEGCRMIDRFCVLRRDHRRQLAEVLGVPEARITVVGAGYRDDLFHPPEVPVADRADQLLVIGKYSEAKGLPWLLTAFERLAAERPGLRLHVAGDGAGDQAERLRERMRRLAPRVVVHGQLGQPDLAALMQRCGVCVLPSFYEGVPLVLVEAAACGCRLVATDLPGVREQIAPAVGSNLDRVPLPALLGVDRPDPRELPAFVDRLTAALAAALTRAAAGPAPALDLTPFTWPAVFARVETVWRELL